MNHISPRDIRRQIGSENVRRLKVLQSWLIAKDPQQDPSWFKGGLVRDFCVGARIAPSVITRGEAMLFNISIPRFSIRIYLTRDRHGFVNARRTVLFADQARRWGQRQNSRHTEGVEQHVVPLEPGEKLPDNRFQLATEVPGWILHTNDCVGDSIIPVPERLSDFRVLTIPVHDLYGEETLEGKDYVGVPYIRHIPLSGGGLCAQAVCFMATMLLHHHAKAIYGIGDITRLTRKKDLRKKDPREIAITGLVISDICTYFGQDTVGLSASPIASEIGSEFRLALQSYLDSGCPVIIPVDAGRVRGKYIAQPPGLDAGESIAASNGIPVSKERVLEPLPHAVLAVGFKGDEFLINDPLLFPVMKARSRQILACGLYCGNRKAPQVLHGLIIPTGPHGLQMHLLERVELPSPDSPAINYQPSHFGLQFIAGTVLGTRADFKPSWRDNSTFRLCKLTEAPRVVKTLFPAEWGELFAEQIEDVTLQLLNRGWSPRNLLWIQQTGARCLVWDAELVPPVYARNKQGNPVLGIIEAFSYLVCEAVVRDGKVSLVCQTAVRKQEAGKNDPIGANLGGRPRLFRGSMISSFNSTRESNREGQRNVWRSWPSKWDFCEFYAFMQDDAARWFSTATYSTVVKNRLKHWWRYTTWVYLNNVFRMFPLLRLVHAPSWKRRRATGSLGIKLRASHGSTFPLVSAVERTACRWKAWKARNGANEFPEVESAADRICENIPPNLKIVGLASYVPEIVSPHAHQREEAVQSLRFLAKLCGELKSREHPAEILEMVGGSRIDGVWPGKLDRSPNTDTVNRTIYVANVMDQDTAIERLIRGINDIVGDAESSGIRLALELEPSPLCVLRNLASLEEFCKYVNGKKKVPNLELHAAFGRVVGLNLDIAHWCLAEITPNALKEATEVLNRIYHVHLSDFSKGHLGDMPPKWIKDHDEDFFAQWLLLLEQNLKTGKGPSCSKYVSCELEASPSSEWLDKAAGFFVELGVPTSRQGN